MSGDVASTPRHGVAPGLRTSDLDYALPPELVATRPAEPRDAARLLVVHRGDPARVEHARVRDLPAHLRAGDLLVRNDTAVRPARLRARRAGTGGRVEGLVLEARPDGAWVVMLRSNGPLPAGDRVELLPPDGDEPRAVLVLVGRDGPRWLARPDPPEPIAAVLARVGHTPLPPYVLKARGDARIDDARDRDWYQTVYADAARASSVAAPTAGLHFTPALLERLADRGVERADVTLEVGPGTFAPVTAETLDAHDMHAERFRVETAALHALAAARAAGRRIVAVGTTTVRTLESLPAPLPAAGPVTGTTDLLIAPPYEPRLVDALLTNFHLPRSTLLALVAAMLGLERLLALYREAIARRYRFYSYGDAMLILP